MTDRSDLIDKVAEAICNLSDTELHDWSGISTSRADYYRAIAQAAIDALELTRQTRETWPSEESGMSGPVHETCWQTPWVVG